MGLGLRGECREEMHVDKLKKIANGMEGSTEFKKMEIFGEGM